MCLIILNFHLFLGVGVGRACMITLNNSNLKVYWQLIPSLLKCFNSIQPCQNWTLKTPQYCMMSDEMPIKLIFTKTSLKVKCSRIFLPLLPSPRIMSLSPIGKEISLVLTCTGSLLIHPFSSCPFWQAKC